MEGIKNDKTEYIKKYNPEDQDQKTDTKQSLEHNFCQPKTIQKITNPEKLQKSTEWISIGDLDGDLKKLIKNFQTAGLIKTDNQAIKKYLNSLKEYDLEKLISQINWTGGNKKVILKGDILADRHSYGLKIIHVLSYLQKQAKKKGGDISTLAGNHDGFMIGFLLDADQKNIYFDNDNLQDLVDNEQGNGFFELTKFIDPKEGQKKDQNNFQNLVKNREKILNNLKETQEGRQILESICNMKLLDHQKDTLFFHTQPTSHMIAMLKTRADKMNIKQAINSMNTSFQNYLKNNLLDKNLPANQGMFNTYFNVFLDTSNRLKKTYGIMSHLKDLKSDYGINNIIYGHMQNGGKINKEFPIRMICNDYKGTDTPPSTIGGNKKNIYVPDKEKEFNFSF